MPTSEHGSGWSFPTRGPWWCLKISQRLSVAEKRLLPSPPRFDGVGGRRRGDPNSSKLLFSFVRMGRSHAHPSPWVQAMPFGGRTLFWGIFLVFGLSSCQEYAAAVSAPLLLSSGDGSFIGIAN